MCVLNDVYISGRPRPTAITWWSSLKKKFCVFNGPQRENTWLRWFSNNKGTDQPALMRSLISAFVTRLLESFISRLAMTEISNFKLFSVDEQTGLNLTLSKTQKTGARGKCTVVQTFYNIPEGPELLWKEYQHCINESWEVLPIPRCTAKAVSTSK